MEVTFYSLCGITDYDEKLVTLYWDGQLQSIMADYKHYLSPLR